MTVMWDDDIDEDEYLLDVLDTPPVCPRCDSTSYGLDAEFSAFVCDACGLWIENDPNEPF